VVVVVLLLMVFEASIEAIACKSSKTVVDGVYNLLNTSCHVQSRLYRQAVLYNGWLLSTVYGKA